MFQYPKCDYTQLLKAASAAKIQSERGRELGLHSKGGNLLEDEKTSNHNSWDTSPIAASVTSMESKLEQLTTIVKSAQKVTDHGNSKVGTQSLRDTPKKMRGPATSAAGPFNKGKKPFQCWQCGGWGHTSRKCPSQGNFNWKEQNKSRDKRGEGNGRVKGSSGSKVNQGEYRKVMKAAVQI